MRKRQLVNNCLTKFLYTLQSPSSGMHSPIPSPLPFQLLFQLPFQHLQDVLAKYWEELEPMEVAAGCYVEAGMLGCVEGRDDEVAGGGEGIPVPHTDQ